MKRGVQCCPGFLQFYLCVVAHLTHLPILLQLHYSTPLSPLIERCIVTVK
jgi:hypothetical protein